MRTLLIGLSGADWKTLDTIRAKTRLPFLSKLESSGTRSDCHGLAPFVPEISWATVLTGNRPWRHCALHRTMNSDVPLIWDYFSKADYQTICIGWPKPLCHRHGISITEEFFKKSGTNDTFSELENDLADLQVDENSLDPNIIRLLCPSLTAESAGRDPKAGRLARSIAHHYSIHNTACSLLETEKWDFAAVHFPIFEHFHTDFGNHLFAPELVPIAEKERYQGLSSNLFKLFDLLLSQLLRDVLENTRIFIVSPYSAIALTAPGMLLASGKGIKSGIRVPDASIVHITPSILHACEVQATEPFQGIPIHDWFDGQAEIHQSILQDSPDSSRLPSPHQLPSNLSSWYLGIDLYESGFPHEALNFLKTAHNSLPESAAIAYWLARCQFRIGHSDAAITTCEIIHDHAIESTSCQFFLGVLALENGQYDQALSFLRQAHEIPETRLYLAAALLATGNLQEAIQLIHQQIREDPNALAWLILGRCQFEFSLYESAADAARNSIRIDAQCLDAWNLLKCSLEKIAKNSTEEAIARRQFDLLMNQQAPRKSWQSNTEIRTNLISSNNFSRITYSKVRCGEEARANLILNLRHPPTANEWHQRVWRLENPTRLIGAALIQKVEPDQSAAIHLNFQPRLLGSDSARFMLEELLEELGNLGIKQTEILTSRRMPWETLLAPHSYKWTGCDELWSGIDVRAGQSRYSNSRMKNSHRLIGWKSRAIENKDWETIRKWSVGGGYLPESRLTNFQNQLDPDASGVVESPNGLEGVLVATRYGMQQIIQFMGACPERKGHWPIASWLLFERFGNVGRAHPHGDVAVMTTCPVRAPYASALARRFGGSIVETIHRFST
ncbi:tetratricopeptide repeat protein [Luteolibacter pohnpeiensis]|uniref:Tetratricopeptide repeat protein n=1 Tax=Luteolibacter pohnpeiensis TaxID=454153 RepID=A0A934VSL7_9BACT|nr:tetratricopeptide repeat protein [Luteolibacter pohnpeiensis]MBK1884451.1 tetratricopeptide repeat protein [Luteolibacter pohnpeiensis]